MSGFSRGAVEDLMGDGDLVEDAGLGIRDVAVLDGSDGFDRGKGRLGGS